jgi:TonB family protein
VIASTPPCVHPPVPTRIVALATLPGKTARRPYVTVIMTVDANGRVTGTRVDDSSGDPAWDKQAEASAAQWTFLPAADGCKAVSGTAEYAVGTGPEVTFADPCEHPADVHAKITPQVSKDTLAGRLNGTTIVQVSLDQAGRVMSASFVQSAGSELQDHAAYIAALTSTYTPAIQACRPIDGGYWFKVTYNGLKQQP